MLVTMELKLPAKIRKRGRWFVSSCDLLDVHSQGKTHQDAERNLRDALASFVASCYERGTLDSVLRGAGFVVVSGRTARQDALPKGSSYVTVPVPFEVQAGHARALSA